MKKMWFIALIAIIVVGCSKDDMSEMDYVEDNQVLCEKDGEIITMTYKMVGDEEFDTAYNSVLYDLMEKYSKGYITIHEFANAVFDPWEQVNKVQANLLGAAFMVAC